MARCCFALVAFLCSLQLCTAQPSVTGRAPHLKGTTVYLLQVDPHSSTYGTIKLDSAPVAKDGSFRFAWRPSRPERVTIGGSTGDIWIDLYLMPNDSLDVTVSQTKDPSPPRFSGRGAEINRFMTNDISKQINTLRMLWLPHRNAGSDAFGHIASDSLRNALARLDNGMLNEPRYAWLRSFATEEMQYAAGYAVCEYLLRTYYWADDADFSTLDTSIFGFVRQIPLGGDAPSRTWTARHFVGRHLAVLTARHRRERELVGDTIRGVAYHRLRFDLARTSFIEGMRDAALAEALTSLIDDCSRAEHYALAASLLDTFAVIAGDTAALPMMRASYEKRTALAPGRMAPDFILTDIEGKRVSLSSLRGKVIYLDFWGTWCGPCLEEIPYTLTLQKELAKRTDVVMVGVALEYRNQEGWKKFIRKKKLGGVQLYLEDQFNGEVAKLYMISGVPTYMLIDKEGRIITADAPRPSDERIREALAKATDG